VPVAPTFPLGEVCSFVGGGTPSRKVPEYFVGAIPWATVKDFKQHRIADTEEHITEQAVADSAANIVQAGTVLLVSRVGLGKAAIADSRLAINQDIKALTPRGDILPEYLFWFLLSKGPDIERMGTGATVKGITLNDIKAIQIPVPTPVEQRRIVDLLSRAEGIVRLRREAEKKAAELIPAMFIDIFGDPATNPKGWPVESLDSVARIISGATKGRRFDPSEAIELPYMRVANVKDGHLDLTDIKTIAVKRSEVEKYRLLPGDLLMTEGGDPDKLGRGALWSGEIETCLHQNHIFKVRADRSHLLPEYLCELVGSRYGKVYFLRVAKKTTGIATINRTQLGCFPVVVPPLNRQTEFVEKFGAVRSIQSQQSAATAKAQATFDALLARTFAP
jgi:type I restriction enzyme S subunit